MKINRIELIEILDSMGIEYELDSETPGFFTEDDKRISFSSLKSPSKYYNSSTKKLIDLVYNAKEIAFSYKKDSEMGKGSHVRNYASDSKFNYFKITNKNYHEVCAA